MKRNPIAQAAAQQRFDNLTAGKPLIVRELADFDQSVKQNQPVQPLDLSHDEATGYRSLSLHHTAELSMGTTIEFDTQVSHPLNGSRYPREVEYRITINGKRYISSVSYNNSTLADMSTIMAEAILEQILPGIISSSVAKLNLDRSF